MYELVDQKNNLTYLCLKTEKQLSQCCHEKLRLKYLKNITVFPSILPF